MALVVKLHAEDISCHHCKMTVERELGELEGVLSVDVDVPAKDVTLEVQDQETLAEAKALLDEIGYPVSA